MVARSGVRPKKTKNTLLVVFRDKAGAVSYVAVGSALLVADWGAALSMLPSGEEAEGLADFFCDTPAQAERAMDDLAEIGDVPFHPRDFAPRWFSPRRGSAAVSCLLANRNGRKARQLLTEAVCAELEHLRRILDGARRRGYRFHFVEAEPGEDLTFAGPALSDGPENNQVQRTAHGQAERRR
jgi:hypothetical protein